MQNLPVITAQPAPPAQTPTPADNGSASQAAEPFGNVLARQRSSTDSPQASNKSDGKQQGSSAAAANDAAATSDSNQTTQTAAPVPDAPTTLPGDMLATLLPPSVVTSTPSTKDKNNLQAPAPDGVSTLPSDMLAMMLPAAAGTVTPVTKDKTSPQTSATDVMSTSPGDMLSKLLPANTSSGKRLQESILAEGKKTQSLPIATTPSGASLKSAVSKTAPETLAAGFSTAKDTKDNATFTTVLASSGKDGAITAPIETSAAKIQMQQVAPPAVDSLLQSGIAPIAAGQSGVAQAAQAVINTPVTDQAWGNEFNQKITWMATQHEQTAELHLNPPNLGPLDVVLKVSGDQATALFTSPHAAVREAVQQALPQLRNMMADNGITLGNAMVSDQSPKDQQAWQANQQQKGSGGAAGTIAASVATGSIPSVATTSLGSLHQGMVDTFA